MNISVIAHRWWRVVFLLVTVLVVFGGFSYFSLPAREDPAITNREAVVTTRFPGLSPSKVERLVTRTIEEAAREVEEVEEVRSASYAGVSIVHVEVDDSYFNLDQIWDELRNKVAKKSGELPDGAMEPVVNSDFGDVAVVTIALQADGFTASERLDMARFVQDRLYTVEGTKRVDLYGAPDQRIFVEADEARLAELGLPPRNLADALRSQNVIRPGGEIDTGERAFLVEPSGSYDTVREVEETLIRVPDSSRVVPLRDIATIERSIEDPPSRLAYYDGEPAIVVAVSMLESQSVLDYSERVKAAVGGIRQALPVGYELNIVTYQAEQVENAVYGVTESVLQTLAIVLAVVVFFLGLRTGLIVGAIVPAVMLVTLAVMGFFGMTLERMSLATLVIALGLLVDNGIVIAEDFKRRLEEGASRDEALKRTGGELALPLLSSTLTTVLVFLPLMLADHVSGEYTRSISLVVLITLLASWVLAMTVTPTLCHWFIRVRDPDDEPGFLDRVFDPVNRAYEHGIRRVLRHRALFMASMVGLLAAAIAGIYFAPKKFFPDSDRSQLLTYVDLPAGVTTRTTDAVFERIFDIVEDDERFPHIEHHAGYVGFGGPRFVLSLTPIDPAPNRGFLIFDVDELAHVDGSLRELRRAFREELPWVSARVTKMFLGPSDSTKLEVQVKGPDADVLRDAARRVEQSLLDVPGAVDLWNDWENRVPKIHVAVDQARARRAGVTSANIATGLARTFTGSRVTRFREGDEIFPVVSRGPETERMSLEALRNVNVGTATDGTVPLDQVADFKLQGDQAVLAREDLERTITVAIRSTRMSAEDMVPLVSDDLDAIEGSLPPGHAVEIDGVVAQSADGKAALAANVPLCLGLVVLLLVAQFNSFRRSGLILMTIPLILIGASLSLYVMQADFGFMVILGIYSLAGILINNAIVLIDRIDIERDELPEDGDVREAIVSASVRRLRPILMTTVTTVVGLLPLIISRDPLFYGLAAVVAWGLLVGTLLTLGVVPALYSAMLGRSNRPDPADDGPEGGPPSSHRVTTVTALLLVLGIAGGWAPSLAVAQTDSADATVRRGDDDTIEAFLGRGDVPLDAERVERRVTDTSPTLDARERAEARARDRVDEARPGLFPVVGISGGYSRIGGFDDSAIQTGEGAVTIDIPRNRTQVRAFLDMPVSDVWFRMRPTVEAAAASVEAAVYERRVADLDVRLRATTLYLDYVEAKAELYLARTDVERAREQLRVVQARADVGLATDADLLDVRARFRQGERRVVQTEGALEASTARLAIAMHVERAPVDGWSVAPPPPTSSPASVDVLLDAARTNRPELQALDAAADAARARQAASLGEALPSVDVFASYTYANPNPNQIPPQEEFQGSWEVGVGVEWTINQLARGRAASSADGHEVARLRAERRRAADQIRAEVTEGRVAVETARAAVDAAEARLAAADAAYDARFAELEAGGAVIADLLASDATLADARRDLVAARIGVSLAEARLERATGGR